ncbi:HAMP domain-containing sensor histidine kinase [Iodobacter sp. LRB]|uniref:HAMP domain-containing sensor histidine kinase n=1 Tax=unclassified Iodobacter TaxID=235634 RepID=UPI000C1115E8|nr:HAMP domain-containing sensor histidine kinase [Iodobacter sp. BJB302]PHV02827.1 two-component sensor histidine kinase [Iodobacter sp. BJB302]
MRHKLYWQIYFTVVGSLVLFALLAGLLYQWHDDQPPRRLIHGTANLLAAALPPADRPVSEQAAAFTLLTQEFDIPISLYAAGGQIIASVGEPLDLVQGKPRIFQLRLPDQRLILVGRPPHREKSPGLLAGFAMLALAIAIAAIPLTRKLTRRLEALANQLDALGEGDFSVRLPVHGKDEVSRLSMRFNRAAGQIAELLSAHKNLLAHASHELRSPLARLQMAATLLGDHAPAHLQKELSQNISELNELVEEILLMSRLDARPESLQTQRIDLLELCQIEAAPYQASVKGAETEIEADPRLLKRLIRNLLENARRYGAAPFSIRIDSGADGVLLYICDQGPGIAAAAQPHIFEPFYRTPGTPEGKGGHGLGLALVKRIAEHHGGDVEYQTPAEGGSCFKVSLKRQSQAMLKYEN